MIDWTNTDGFKDLPLLPSNLKCQLMENNMGKERSLGLLLHFTGLLPFILKNYQKFPDCPWQNKYTENTPKRCGHMHSHVPINVKTYSANRKKEDKCSSIIYVADSDMTTNQCKLDFSKWVKNEPDIYILLDGNENHHCFQFVLNEEMHRFFYPLPTKNNVKALVSKQTKTNLRKAFGLYMKDNTHCISVISTLPYNSKDSLTENVKLDFVDVIVTLSLMFGDSPEYGLKRQLISSSCCPWSEPYGYEKDQGNKKVREALIDDNESEDAPVLNLNTQRASPQQITKAKDSGLAILIDCLRSRQSPGPRGKVLQNLKQASIANSQQRWGKTSGRVAFSKKAIGCRLECEKINPETSPYSIRFTITVSAEQWNRLLGNTLNTIQAQGHLPIITTAKKKETVLTQASNSTRLPDSQTVPSYAWQA
jgi:hypothetical protein